MLTAVKCIPAKGKGKGRVTAVTSLGDDLFVMRLGSKTVEVYDAESLSLQREIEVRELGSCCWGLAACSHHQCLYVSDTDNDSVHRAELAASNALTKWSVSSVPRGLSSAKQPKGLSVNEARNVLVACHNAKRIQEHRTNGDLVREINLRAGVTSPWHAVQLSSGHYVVSQNSSPGVVCVIKADGQVVHTCKCEAGMNLMYPTSVAVKKNDMIYVADSANDRILTMDSSLKSMKELTLRADDASIHRPSGLCLDESRGRLYVGEYSGSYRVLVVDSVKL